MGYHLETCPLCSQETVREDIVLYAHEVDYTTGQIILRRYICIVCFEEIETRNTLFYRLLFYFEERPLLLAKLRGEHYKNRELAYKPQKKKRGKSRSMPYSYPA